MTPERGERVSAIFEAALKCDPAGRSALLERLCGGDPELRAEVESLLAQDAEAERAGFLAPPSSPGPGETGPRRAAFGLLGLDVHIRCPHCRNPIELVGLPAGEVVCPACGSTFRLERESTASRSPRDGRRLGRFELIEAVGVGAFGTVYKARDPKLDRVVAIKVPRSGSLATEEDRDRFLREARSVAQLRHPGIVPVHEVGEHEEAPYLVSEFVQGVTLSDLLTARRRPPREAARLVAEVADALQYAHERGVVHRDVKPSNVMLDDVGRPHLMDFGLAKRDAGEVTMTIEGQVLGTPAYMSPEQARGEAHKVDGRSDVYSLGVILYELLTGELPFRGSQRMLLHQVLHDEPKPPRRLNDRIPRDLETICLKAMAKEPARRYATAGEFAEDLRRYDAGKPIRARRVGGAERAWRWCRRNPVVAGLSAAFWLASIASVALLVIQVLTNKQLSRANEEGKRLLTIARIERTALHAARTRTEFPQRGLLLAAEAIAISRRENVPIPRVAEQSLRDALAHVGGWGTATCEASVAAVAMSPNNRWLVTALHDAPGYLWHLDGEKIATGPKELPGHEGFIRHAAISPNGRWLVTTEHLGTTARLWDLFAEDPTAKSIVLAGHTARISQAVISANSSRLVTVAGGDQFVRDRDTTVRVWDLNADDPAANPRVLDNHDEAVYTAAISRDGRRLVSAGYDKTARVWDLSRGDPAIPVAVLRGHGAVIWSVALSADGRWVATASADKTARLWDLTTADPSSNSIVLRDHEDQVWRVDFTNDGRHLITLGVDRKARLWDLRAANPARDSVTLEGHRLAILNAELSPDGRWLATGSSDKQIRLWDLHRVGTTQYEPFVLHGHEGPVMCLAFSHDSTYLSSGSWDGTVRTWDLNNPYPDSSDEVVNQLEHPISHLVSSPDDDWLLTSSDGPRVVLHRLVRGRVARSFELRHEAGLSAASFSQDGRWLVTGERSGPARLWDLRLTNPSASPLVLGAHRHGVAGLALSPNSRWLATTGTNRDTSAWLWDLSRDDHAATPIELRGHRDGFINMQGMDLGEWHARNDAGAISDLAFDPRSRWLATGGTDRTVRLWDLTTGHPADDPRVLSMTGFIMFSHDDYKDDVRLAFSSDGRWLAAGGELQQVHWWELRDDYKVAEPVLSENLTGGIHRLGYSPDGRWLLAATGIYDAPAYLWDMQSLRVRRAGHNRSAFRLGGQKGYIAAFAFSPDSRWVATTGHLGRTGQLWDLTALDPSRAPVMLSGHENRRDPAKVAFLMLWDIIRRGEDLGGITSFVFSPDRRKVITCSGDQTVRIWDLGAENVAMSDVVLRGHWGVVRYLSLSSDLRSIFSAGDDGMVRRWELDIDDLTGKARRVAGRQLTEAERVEFLRLP